MSAEIPAGAMRFNSDSQKLEYWNGSAWFQIHTATPDLASAGDRQPGARAVFGAQGQSDTSIDYINIASTGNSVDFGVLSEGKRSAGTFSSAVRGVFGGGRDVSAPSFTAEVETVIISSTGNAVDFGDNLNTALRAPFGLSNSTRGIFGGGYTPTSLSLMEYTTIDAQSNFQDFGDLQTAQSYMNGCASSSRGLISSAGPSFERIDFVTISTLGDSVTFGDLTSAKLDTTAVSNSTRALFAGGGSPVTSNIIEYVTISTLGDSTSFGDLVNGTGLQGMAGAASPTRGVFAYGSPNPGDTNTIQYVTISTQGDAVDFGDMGQTGFEASGFSNAHGGL